MHLIQMVYLIVILILGNLTFLLTSDVKKYCANKNCLPKCCPEGQHLKGSNRAVDSCNSYVIHKDSNFNDIPVYDTSLYKTSKTVANFYDTQFLLDNFVELNSSATLYLYVFNDTINSYLSEDATLYIENPNTFNRWVVRNSSYFCIDYLLPNEYSPSPTPVFWVSLKGLNEPGVEESDWWNYFVTAALIISFFCLILVMAVYALLPDLRNLCGLILMAYVGSLLMAYTALAALRILVYFPIEERTCLLLTLILYFSILSTFFWMNVMSFDIWWTFRGYAKARPIHRRGERFKFIVYNIYAWGIPLAMMIFVAVIYHMDLKHIPWFIKPNIQCFFEDGAKMFYLYVPMLIIIISNWVFFLMTAYNVWRLSRNTGVLDSGAAGKRAEHRNQRNRFMVYVKLCVIMGVTWVLEVMTFFTPTLKVWHLADLFHALIGSVIFLIFVCKKKILNKLKKRLQSFKQQQWGIYVKNTSSNTTDSDVSTQETPLQVCPNPTGTDYYKSY